jgi:uncharacterized protein
MTEQNRALIRSLYAAFQKGDIATVIASLAPDVSWFTEGPTLVPYTGPVQGTAAVVEMFQAMGAAESGSRLTMSEPIVEGDQVAAVGRYSATVKATGKIFDVAVMHFFTVRDGKVARFYEVMDTAGVVDAYRS